jgi:hypothetical protein
MGVKERVCSFEVAILDLHLNYTCSSGELELEKNSRRQTRQRTLGHRRANHDDNTEVVVGEQVRSRGEIQSYSLLGNGCPNRAAPTGAVAGGGTSCIGNDAPTPNTCDVFASGNNSDPYTHDETLLRCRKVLRLVMFAAHWQSNWPPPHSTWPCWRAKASPHRGIAASNAAEESSAITARARTTDCKTCFCFCHTSVGSNIRRRLR